MPLMLGAWLRGGLRLLPWALLMGSLGVSGWWRYYLAPRHMPYLWAGFVVLLLVLVLSELDGWLARMAQRRAALAAREAERPAPRPPSLPDWLEAGVHWLPLLMLVALGPSTLSLRGGAGSSQQLKRLRPEAGARQEQPAPVADPWAAGDPEYLAALAEAPISEDGHLDSSLVSEFLHSRPSAADQAQSEVERLRAEVEATDAELEAIRQRMQGPEADEAGPASGAQAAISYKSTDLVALYVGRGGAAGSAVDVLGRLHKVEGDDPVVPLGVDPASVKLVLYRYAIFCCVADAIPVTAVLEGYHEDDVLDEQWVRLRGKFEQTGSEGDIPLLKVDHIEWIDEPVEPYLYIAPTDL